MGIGALALGALPMPGYQGFDAHLVVSHVWSLGETGAITVPVDGDLFHHISIKGIDVSAHHWPGQHCPAAADGAVHKNLGLTS